jgi:hypothetical protein
VCVRALLGMAAGGLGQLFASPADLIKIRLQGGVPLKELLIYCYFHFIHSLLINYLSQIYLLK